MEQATEQTDNTIEKEPKKALLIDDDDQIITLAKINLRSKGDSFVAVKFTTVDQAIEAVETVNPNVVFLDHNLTHGGEGLKIAAIIKERWPEITIYSTSTNFHEEDIGEMYKQMEISYIEKNDYTTMKTKLEE